MKLLATLIPPLSLALPCAAQVEEARLYASDGAYADGYGWAVALDGPLAVVGAPSHDALEANSGAAWVHLRTPGGWVEQHKLLPSTGSINARFGYALALEGTSLVVGAPQDAQLHNQGGAVYVFERQGGGWVEVQELRPDSSHAAHHGRSVALDGDTLAVGAPRDDDAALKAGAVYVYVKQAGAWTLQQKVLPEGVTGGEAAGFRVALEGDLLVATAPDDETGGVDEGRAYVFRRSGATWSQEAELAPVGGDDLDEYGWAVALSGGTIAVGAYGDGEAGFRSGAAHLYEQVDGAWTLTQKLTPPPGACCQHMGLGLDLDGDRLVVGAETYGAPPSTDGAAYLYEREAGAWVERAVFAPLAPGPQEYFGVGVALDGDRALIGARNASSPLPDAHEGVAYAFLFPELFGPFCAGDGGGAPCPCGNPGAAGEGCANSSGNGATLVHSGSTSVTADALSFHAAQLPAQPVLLFAGDRVLGGGDGVAFGDGLRCAGGAVLRLGITAGDAGGAASWGPGLVALGGFQPGDERAFQAWYRDPQGGPCASGFNLSNAVAILFVP